MSTNLGLDFVRDSDTPETFDGYWQVWRGTTCIGLVRRSDDPLNRAKPWGYRMPTVDGRLGIGFDEGYRTRADAAHALMQRFIGADHG